MLSKRKYRRSFSPSVPWWAQEGAGRSVSHKSKAGKAPTNKQQQAAPSSYKQYQFGAAAAIAAITESHDYFDNFDQAGNEKDEDEDELLTWIRQDPTRGVLRVHRPESTFSDLVRCTLLTPAETVMSKCLTRELFVVFTGHFVRKLSNADIPLKIQSDYLRTVGFSDDQRIQEEGYHTELAHLIKFVTGFETDSDLDHKAYLSTVLKVKEGTWITAYSKRFCVVCCTRLYIYKLSVGGSPHSKPSYSITLSEITVTNHTSSKHPYCIKLRSIMDREPEIVLAFGSHLQRSKWVNRIKKLMAKPFKTVHLNACGLEEIPQYLFLDPSIHTLHLTKNYLLDKSASLGQSDHSWLSNLRAFTHLTNLSLRDNKLESFPISICSLVSLTDLNMSSNRIKEIPPEIGQLVSLLVLQMQSNLLTNLPYHLRSLNVLMTLSISFNRLAEIPHVVKELRLLKTLLAAGNMISEIPDDIHKLQNLEELDVRFNNITTPIPHTLQGLKRLKTLRVNNNALSNIDMTLILSVQKLDCSCNKMDVLSIGNSASTVMLAQSNSLNKIVFEGGYPANLTVLDLSRNQLTEVPPELCSLLHLQQLDLSRNLLSSLPDMIFSCKGLRILSVSHNQLTVLPTARRESNLEQLAVNCNSLVKLPLSISSRANKLQVLNVSSNKLAHLPALPPCLVELYATDNNLSQLDFISHCSSLRTVQLAYNKISSISASFFISFKQLDMLGLAGNRLVNFPVSIGACQKLQALYLNSNKLTELPPLSRNNSLTTLDISHNQLRSMQRTWIPKKLNDLDVSGNVGLSTNIGTLSRNLHSVSHIVFEGKVGKSKAARVAVGGMPAHGKWSYGSSYAPSASSPVKCVVQVKNEMVMINGGPETILAVVDGNGSPDATHALQTLLIPTISEELQRTSTQDSLLYLEHTFLVLHRQLGEVGQHAGASLLLCHLMITSKHERVIHVANTGLCEAVLCRNGEAMQLVSPHAANTNSDERQRIIELRGFITKDGMVNATSKSSRLIGSYHLHPYVIPLPSTMSIQLTEADEFLILANDAFWACTSHSEAIGHIRHVTDAKMAASKLRDIALASGNKEEISVIVIRLSASDHSVGPHASLVGDDEDEYPKQYYSGSNLKQGTTIKPARPKTVHGESSAPYSTASLGRTKQAPPTHTAGHLAHSKSKSVKELKSEPTDTENHVITSTSTDAVAEVQLRKKGTSQWKHEEDTDDHHRRPFSVGPESISWVGDEPVARSQRKTVHNIFVPQDDSHPSSHDPLPPLHPSSHDSPPLSRDTPSLSHSSSFSMLNESGNPTWFESLPPVQLGDSFGCDTFGLELGMTSEVMPSSNRAAVNSNVTLSKRDVDQGWGTPTRTRSYIQPQRDLDREKAKTNFNFDELMAGLDSTWATAMQSLPENTDNTRTANTSTSAMSRDDSFLGSPMLIDQFDQTSVEEDTKALNDLISQLSEFVNDTS